MARSLTDTKTTVLHLECVRGAEVWQKFSKIYPLCKAIGVICSLFERSNHESTACIQYKSCLISLQLTQTFSLTHY